MPMFKRSCVVLLVTLASACSGSSSSPTPSAPSQSVPSTYTLTGVVLSVTPTGLTPVEGAQVRVPGLHGAQFAATDSNGYYNISGVPASSGDVVATKAGYAGVSKTLTISGDTRLDFQLGPRVAISTLSGVVSEVTPTGLVPLEGVRIEELSCDPAGPIGCPVHISSAVVTDKNGFYSISGLFSGTGNNTVWASKAGYQDSTTDLPACEAAPCRIINVNGDTRLDIQLVRR